MSANQRRHHLFDALAEAVQGVLEEHTLTYGKGRIGINVLASAGTKDPANSPLAIVVEDLRGFSIEPKDWQYIYDPLEKGKDDGSKEIQAEHETRQSTGEGQAGPE